MKRIWIAGLALLLVAGLAAFAFGEDEEYNRGPGWGWGMMGGGMMGGPGMMGGSGGMGGPGMMGGGMMGWGWGPGADLTKEQADQLEQIQFNTMRSMRAMMYENRDRMIAMQKAMTAFPVDEKAAMAQWQSMNQVRMAMFALHVSALSQAQQVIGKEKWEEMMSNMGGSGGGMMGGPGGRGPGMMRNR